MEKVKKILEKIKMQDFQDLGILIKFKVIINFFSLITKYTNDHIEISATEKKQKNNIKYFRKIGRIMKDNDIKEIQDNGLILKGLLTSIIF